MAAEHDNIVRLTETVVQWAKKKRVSSTASKAAACDSIARSFPISHSTAAITLAAIHEGGGLKSRKQLEPKAKWRTFREYDRGTLDDVFFFVAEIRFPAGPTSAGILFHAAIESEISGGRACPFDTGGLGEYFSVPASLDLADTVREYEMPAPSYRGCFAQWLNVCYDEPLDYLKKPSPKGGSPIGVEILKTGCDDRAWTFEVRFPKAVPLIADTIDVVFLHDERITDSRIEMLATWANATDKLQVFEVPPGDVETFASLKKASREYIERNLKDLLSS